MRKKREKIRALKNLVGERPEVRLNDDDISFLKGRKVDCEALLTSKQPLIIYATDSEKTANKIVSIADKLDCPVIRLVHNVIKSGTEPGKVVLVTDEPERATAKMLGVSNETIRKDVNKVTPDGKIDTEYEEVINDTVNKLPPGFTKSGEEPEEVQEDEPVIKPGVKYRLSFPNIWDIDDDDETPNTRIKTYFR